MRKGKLYLTFCILVVVIFALVLAVPILAVERVPIYVLVMDKDGEIITEGEDSFGDGWGVLSCISPEGDYITLADGSWQLVLKPAGTATSNPTPVEPVGDFFTVTFTDGSLSMLRLPIGLGENVERAEARYRGQAYQFEPITEVEAARIQLNGAPWPEFSNKPPVDILVSRADNRSLIAFTDGKGQKEALIYAAEAVTGLLETFHRRHGEYPESLCELCKGDRKVISATPRNPYQYDKTLCRSLTSQPRPRGSVKYFPQFGVDEDGGRKAVGYWLAVLADGPETEPLEPLPADYEIPSRAIRWFESHPVQDKPVYR